MKHSLAVLKGSSNAMPCSVESCSYGSYNEPSLTRVRVDNEPYCTMCLADAVTSGEMTLSSGPPEATALDAVEVEWSS